MATKVKTGVIDSSAITSALIANASITADDLHATLDLTGKTVTVATASAGDNDTSVASTSFVSTAIANLADSAPSTLDTLNELAAALGDDASFSTTVTNSIATKLPLAGGTLTGNLLIGTTDAGYPAYGDELTIGSASGNNGMTIRSGTSNYGTFYFSDATGNGAGTYAGKLQYNHSNNSMVLATNSVDRLTIDASGHVGIGTTSPSSYSAYADNLVVAGSGETGITIASGNSSQSGLYFSDGTSGTEQYIGFLDYNHSSNALIIGTSGAEKMRIDSSGKVGIGNTAPASLLDVGSTSSTGAQITITTNTNSYGGLYFADGADEAYRGAVQYKHGDDFMHFYTAGAERMRIDSSGDVRFAANATGAALIKGISGDQTNRNAGGYPQYTFVGNEGTGMRRASSNILAFDASGAEVMRIASGKVAIGTTSPANLLEIVGGGYDQIRIGSNQIDNTAKTAGIVSTTYTNQSVSVFQMYNQNGSNAVYYGSADGAHRGINQHYFYTNSNYNATTGHKLRYLINGTGKHTFYGKHQGDSVGHFLFTNQVSGEDATNTNCTLAVQNGGTFIQIMGWTTLGARIGTRTGGWSSNSGGDVYFTRQDATSIKLASSGPQLGNGTAISSDERLKENITDITDGQLAKICALTPRNFTWKDTRKTGTHEGFIAQEVEAVIPEAVFEDNFAPDPDDDSRDFEGDIKLIRHEVINARLIKAVQELSAKLEAAEARITTLEG